MTLFKCLGVELRVKPSCLSLIAFLYLTISWMVCTKFVYCSSIAIHGIIFLWIAMLVASLWAHEMGHAIIAKLFNYEVDGIELWFLGGFAILKSAPKSPRHQFWIGLWGPLANFVIAAMAYAVAQNVPGESVYGWMAMWTYRVNLIFGWFNLLPALPLDGGRILHAICWGAIGKRFADFVSIIACFIMATAMVCVKFISQGRIKFDIGLIMVTVFIVLVAIGKIKDFQKDYPH